MVNLLDEVKDLDLNKDSNYLVSLFENEIPKESNEKTLERLYKDSQKSEYANVLIGILNKDKGNFLQKLYKLGDTKSKVLMSVLDVQKSGKSQILDILEYLLKVVDDTELDSGLAGYYLDIYLALISTFKVTHSNDIIPILKCLTSYILIENSQPIINELLPPAILTILKELEINKENTIDQIDLYLKRILDHELSITEFLNLTKLIEVLFPVIPHIIGTIYTSDKCKKAILHQVNMFTYDLLSISLNRIIATEILKMISSSCIDDTCRNYNVTNYLSIIELGVDLDSEKEIHLLSILDLIKLWNFIKLEKESGKKNASYDITYLFHQLLDYLKVYELDKNDKLIDVCVEGLAYLSLNTKCKQEMRESTSIMKILLSILQKFKGEFSMTSTSQYGILLILSNLCKLKDSNLSEDKKTVNYLKNISNANSNKEAEDQEKIHAFNKTLLIDHDIIGVFSILKVNTMDQSRPNKSVIQIIQIINLISENQEKLVKQEIMKRGGLNILMDFLVKYSGIKKPDMTTHPIIMEDDLINSRISALRAMARCLISVNPSLAFKKYDIKTCVPFLVELLGVDVSEYESIQSLSQYQKYLLENITILDKFESLLALTNISSLNDSALKKLVTQRTFDKYLDNFIIDADNPDVQRASWELVSNLITEPSMLVKFFNIEDTKSENYKRLNLLIKLINSKDEKLQITVAGLLANATSEFEMIAQILNKDVKIQKDLIQIFIDILVGELENKDLILRVSYTLLNLVYASLDLNSIMIYRNNKKLIESLVTLAKKESSKEVLEIITETLKVILKG